MLDFANDYSKEITKGLAIQFFYAIIILQKINSFLFNESEFINLINIKKQKYLKEGKD